MSRRYLKRSSRVRRARTRRGAALLETALTIMVFLMLVFGMLDLGIGVLRHQQLTEAARFVARKAAVHGAFADRLGVWGITTMSGNANDGTAIGDLFKQRMPNNSFANIVYEVNWIDGGNDVRNDHRVQVTVTLPYQPIVTFVFGSPSITLRTISIAPIAH